MPRRANPFRVGLFVLICVALIIAVIAWIVISSRFQYTKTYACYFNESVKGLQKDAIVNYRGVPVGRVSDIALAPDGRLIEVLLALKSDFRVDLTIAAQLREQGLTGLQYLEIDKAPGNIEQITPKTAFPAKYPVIRTQPSELAQLKNALQDIYAKVSQVDLKGLTDSWTRTSQLMNELLVQLGAGSQPSDIKETITALRQASQNAAALLDRISKAASEQGINQGFSDLGSTLAASRQAMETLAKQLKALPPETIKQISRQLGQTVQSSETLVTNLNTRINDASALLEQDLQQLRILLTELNSLVRSLKEQPNRLIFPSKEQQEPFKKK